MEILDFIASDAGKVVTGALIVFTGQIVVAALSWLKDASSTGASQRKEAEYLAIRLVLALENMVGEAYDGANDPQLRDEEGEVYPSTPEPKLVLPQDANYKVLPARLMYRVLSLPNRLNSFESGQLAVAEIDFAPDYREIFRYRSEQLSKIGLEALSIIDALCSEYKIPEPDRADGYDPRDGFERNLAKAKARQERESKSELVI